MAREKIVVAMSGGVDSSVVAAMLQADGSEVVGATLRLKHPDPAFSQAQACANKSDEEAIDSVVRKLGIEHHYLDRYADFESLVLRPAAGEYLMGRTPNPCCFCNPLVKFGKLLEFAESIGADAVATGHYVRLENDNGVRRIRRGSDPAKDQSYFLYRLNPHDLCRLRFPLGGLEKSTVRAMAESFGLSTAKRPDSQDACFQVGNECFGETLRRLFTLTPRPGVFLFHGREVGRHEGVHRYTIGQRKGLNVALGKPAYITKIDYRSGEIELDTDENALLRQTFFVRELNWQQPVPECFDAGVQIRYRSRPQPAMVERTPDGVIVSADVPLKSVTPGQSAVFYSGDILLGGGVISLC